MAMNCGDCLCNDVVIVELVNGKCPRCGADYNLFDNPRRKVIRHPDGRPVTPAEVAKRFE